MSLSRPNHRTRIAESANGQGAQGQLINHQIQPRWDLFAPRYIWVITNARELFFTALVSLAAWLGLVEIERLLLDGRRRADSGEPVVCVRYALWLERIAKNGTSLPLTMFP